MAVSFEGGYASPILRKAVFDRLHPGSTIEYITVPLDTVVPEENLDDPGQAKTAIVCTIITDDGWWVRGVKEVPLQAKDRTGKWRPVPQTPEQYQADCTKALGRALRDAGIPQKVGELRLMMNWIAMLDGRTPARPERINPSMGSMDPEDVDAADAGGSDELPPEQQVAVAIAERLSGAQKAELARWAKDEFGLTNINRSGEHATDLMRQIRVMLGDEPEEEF